MEIIDLFDASRQRAIPVALYPHQGPFLGWLFFSVGFGGGRAGYAYLGRAWSQLGFQVAVIEHVGSNADALKAIHKPGMRQPELAEAVGRAVHNQAELAARPQDLAYVRRTFCPGGDWAGLAGHSFGSYTAMATLGAEALLPEGPQRWQFDMDWAGVVLMSPQPPEAVISHRGLTGLRLPAFLLTGTKDSGMPAGVTYEQRLQTYDALPAGAKSLAVLEGADHMAFAGIGLSVAPALETVAQLTGEFWLALRHGRSLEWPSSLPVEVDLRVG